jgi:hypothetical protein
VRWASLVVSAPRRRPSMKSERVAAAAYAEGEHGALAANTAGSTPPTVRLQLPTSPVADLPGTAPGHIVPNAHHESSLHYASSGFAAWMPTVRAPLSSTVCSVRSTSTELRDLDESMIFCLGL